MCENFLDINLKEFENQNWTKEDCEKISPGIFKQTQIFNGISFLVINEILNSSSLEKRKNCIKFYIKLAKVFFFSIF